jgi:hypothetical protein
MKWLRKLLPFPTWIVAPLMFLGLFFVVAKPLGDDDWYGYAVSFVVAAIIGAFFWRRRYSTTVLERTERCVTVLYTRVR